MTTEHTAHLIRAYRVACAAADQACAASAAALTTTALTVLRELAPADQQHVAARIRSLLEMQHQADRVCAALLTQLRQADDRIRTFDRWADHDTPAWRWLLTTIAAESAQLDLNVDAG